MRAATEIRAAIREKGSASAELLREIDAAISEAPGSVELRILEEMRSNSVTTMRAKTPTHSKKLSEATGMLYTSNLRPSKRQRNWAVFSGQPWPIVMRQSRT